MIDISIIGNVTKDCELRSTKNGLSVCTFTVATNNRYKKDAPPIYWRVTAWRGLAETCSKFLQKGAKVYVKCDQIEIAPYDANNGEKRFSIEVTAKDIEFLTRANGGSRNDEEDFSGAPEVPSQKPVQASTDFTDVTGDFDELPF